MTRDTADIPNDRLLLHAYVDGELDPVNALAVGRSIAANPELKAEVERIEALRRAMQDGLPREPVPVSVVRKIDAAIGRTPAVPAPTWRLLAASVVLALGIGSTATWLALSSLAIDQTAQSLVDGHVRALMAPQAADVASSERHTVKPWFNGRIPQSPQVADLAAQGFPLAGGRVDVIDNAPVATLVYHRRKHVISVSALPNAAGTAQPALRRSISGYNLVQWTRGGTTYWATSDLNVPELTEFATLFYKSLAN